MAKYLSISEDAIGLVEGGDITEVYFPTDSIKSVMEGNAEPIESSRVGERVKADTLFKVVQTNGEYEVRPVADSRKPVSVEPYFELVDIRTRLMK